MANNSITQLYSVEEKKFTEKKWSDLQVGKIIKVKKNEMIPADILVIKSSEDTGLCYLETTNLDGESALKPRQAIVIYHRKIKDEKCLDEIIDMVEIDLPNNHIYKVEGSVYFKKEEKEKEFFSIDNVLLRVIFIFFLYYLFIICNFFFANFFFKRFLFLELLL